MHRWQSFKEKIEPYLTDTKSNIILTPYTLTRNMSDFEIAKSAKSTPIPVVEFASVMQLFCENADKSKYYIFHVKTDSEVVAVSLRWNDAEWNSNASRFDDGLDWHGGSFFLSPATAPDPSETSNLDTLNSLTLARAIEVCKENGLVVYRPM